MQRKLCLVPLAAGAALIAVACAGVPRSPEVPPGLSETFRAPYDAVWGATLRSLGMAPLRVGDKASGRIETDVFAFVFSVGSGGPPPTQVVWINLTVQVRATEPEATQVEIQARLHQTLLEGFYPAGDINSPWGDLFAKIRGYLAQAW